MSTPFVRNEDPHVARQARVVMCIVTLLFGVTVVSAAGRKPVHSASVEPSTLVTGLDPNVAPWYEFAQLPGIGESVSRRIEVYREKRLTTAYEANVSSSVNSPYRVFNSPADLARVSGIGVRTVRRIAPFLRFNVPVSSVSVDKRSSDG